ncbi:MAG: PKD domain-containing protein, partial [Flavobacteriales bacterium]
INEPPQMVMDSFITTKSKCDDSTGSATAYVSGGNGGYSFNWSSGDTGMVADSLSFGQYNVSVKDSNNCSVFNTFQIKDSLAPTVSASSKSELCDGDCNGELYASASGGTSPYSYIWDNGNFNGDTVKNVCSGTYILSVEDNDGCKAEDTSVTVNSGDPEPVISSINVPSSIGIGETASFSASTISASSFLWEFGDGSDTTGSSAKYVYDTLGTFSVVFTASNSSCSVTESASITVDCGSGDTLIQSINIPDTVDMGDTAVFSANTSLVDSFLWEFGDGVDSAEQNSEHAYDTSGTLVVTFNASNNFCSDSKSETIEVVDPNSIVKVQKMPKNSINVYPNPSKGVVNVELKNKKRYESIEIVNTLGENVKTININKKERIHNLALSNNIEGLYFMKIYDGKGKAIIKKI